MPDKPLKYVSTLIVVLLLTVTAAAQPLAVESFMPDDRDQTARIRNPRKDQNNRVCAIVKMETILLLQDFTFDAGLVGIVHTEQKTGEIWIYLSPGTQRLTISHKYLGTVRNYGFGEALKEATVYILKLKSGNVKTVVEEIIARQYFEVTCAIDGATISIDDNAPKAFESGKFSELLSYGRHQYTVEAPLYHAAHGIVEITAKKQLPLQVTLQPAFGKIVINTQPEQGADVFVDGEKRGQSPLTLDKMRSGEHTVRVLKTLYLPADERAPVSDGQTAILNIAMQPNFAAITFNADGDIYINDEYKAAGNWDGRLASGVYKVEVRKPSHRASLTTIEAKAGEQRTVALDAPAPIYGSLNITANVTAQIYVDNQPTGETTPYLMNQVLAGNHSVELRADGHQNYRQTIEIQEGKIATVQSVLEKTPTTRTIFGCVPSNIELGKVGFVSDKTWNIGTQTWSAPVTATYCNKNTYYGRDYDTGYTVDCAVNYFNPAYGNWFSWCMVTLYAKQLCPSPWRVPTKNDLCQFVNRDPKNCQRSIVVLEDRWGYSKTSGMWFNEHYFMPDVGTCWSSTSENNDAAYALWSENYETDPAAFMTKDCGLTLRCVR
jgi:hypothetical protein